jgi:hypothetical protein
MNVYQYLCSVDIRLVFSQMKHALELGRSDTNFPSYVHSARNRNLEVLVYLNMKQEYTVRRMEKDK